MCTISPGRPATEHPKRLAVPLGGGKGKGGLLLTAAATSGPWTAIKQSRYNRRPNMKQVKVFISDSLSAELLARARALGMSLSGYIRYVLAKMIDDQRKENQP
jgi:hypothetical protein